MFRQWLHLIIVGISLAIIGVTQTIVLTVYQLFPFPSLLDALYWRSKQLQELFSLHLELDTSPPSANDLIHSVGYECEDHFVDTDDGFVLGLHRITHKRDSDCGVGDRKRDVDRDSSRPVVLLVHGLLQNSESFLAAGEQSLAVHLANAGYDVWLGNNRSNRYSYKHRWLSPAEDRYWSFSIDELARYDVPAMIEYVLSQTGHQQLSYIGFSQGTAQAFAAFSLDTALAKRVNSFIALAPAAKTKGLSRSAITDLITSNIYFLFVLFGKRAMLSFVPTTQKIMTHNAWAKGVDGAMKYLFDWSSMATSQHRKPALYRHIFCFSSVKCVVHWFQIMAGDGGLAMFQDVPQKHYQPRKYDIARISCPVALFCGGKDTVVDCAPIARRLPPSTYFHEEKEYEHLDFLWADSAPTIIYPLVLERLAQAWRLTPSLLAPEDVSPLSCPSSLGGGWAKPPVLPSYAGGAGDDHHRHHPRQQSGGSADSPAGGGSPLLIEKEEARSAPTGGVVGGGGGGRVARGRSPPPTATADDDSGKHQRVKKKKKTAAAGGGGSSSNGKKKRVAVVAEMRS